MKIINFIIISLVSVVLVACNANDESKLHKEPNIKELVHEYSTGSKKNESASITSEQLIVTDSNKKERTYDLPKDEFFISIAPYEKNTHPCNNHSLTGCRGEMANKEFSVYIEDTDGNIVVDKNMKSQANGFIDLWLPRDKTYHIKIMKDGKMAKSKFSTFKNDGTCLTNLKLM